MSEGWPERIGDLFFAVLWLGVVGSGLALLVFAATSGPWYAALGGLAVLAVAAVPAVVVCDNWRD